MAKPIRWFGIFFLLAATPYARAGGAPPSPGEIVGAWTYYNNSGWREFYWGDVGRARERFSKAIEYIRPYADQYPRLMSRSCHDLTRVLCAQGRYSDAEPMAKWVVRVRELDPKTRDDVMFDSLYLLAVVHREQGRDDEAIPLLRKAVAIEEKYVGPNDPQLALTIKELADAESRSGELLAAEADYKRSILILKRDKANMDLLDALGSRADVLAKLGRAPESKLAAAEAQLVRESAEDAVRLADHLASPLASRDLKPEAR